MSTIAIRIGDSLRGSGKALTWALWIAQLTVAGILGMAAFAKFFASTSEGSMALAAARNLPPSLPAAP